MRGESVSGLRVVTGRAETEEERRRFCAAGMGKWDPREDAGRIGIVDESAERDSRGLAVDEEDEEEANPNPKRLRCGASAGVREARDDEADYQAMLDQMGAPMTEERKRSSELTRTLSDCGLGSAPVTLLC